MARTRPRRRVQEPLSPPERPDRPHRGLLTAARQPMPPNRVLIADAGASPLMATATRANDCPPASGVAAVLANSGYRRLFIAQTISRWGDIANPVGLVVLVIQLTGSGLKVSGVVIAEILPGLLLAPVAGTVADRLPRIGVMVTADLWRTSLTALLPLASHHLAAVYAIAFVRPAGGVFFNPAAASVLPAVVGEDELIAANSGLWSAAVVSQIALAPLAGAIVTTRGGGSSVRLPRSPRQRHWHQRRAGPPPGGRGAPRTQHPPHTPPPAAPAPPTPP